MTFIEQYSQIGIVPEKIERLTDRQRNIFQMCQSIAIYVKCKCTKICMHACTQHQSHIILSMRLNPIRSVLFLYKYTEL